MNQWNRNPYNRSMYRRAVRGARSAPDDFEESSTRIFVNLTNKQHLIEANGRKQKTNYFLSIPENWRHRILDEINEFMVENAGRRLEKERAFWVEKRKGMFVRHARRLNEGIVAAKNGLELTEAFTRFDKGIAEEMEFHSRKDRKPYQHGLLFGGESIKRG